MTTSLLADAFAHHVWATIRVIDACLPLTRQQLDATAPGTYGSIIETLRHLVGADAGYLFVTTRGQVPELEEAGMDLEQLRSAMVANGPAWAALLGTDLDADEQIVRQRDDGTDSVAPVSIRIAQALHHGTDHRSQVCTVLTTLGVEPPAIDVWDFGFQDGRVFERRRED